MVVVAASAASVLNAALPRDAVGCLVQDYGQNLGGLVSESVVRDQDFAEACFCVVRELPRALKDRGG